MPLMHSGKFQPGGTPAQDNVILGGSSSPDPAAETLTRRVDRVEEVGVAKEGRTQGLCWHAGVVH